MVQDLPLDRHTQTTTIMISAQAAWKPLFLITPDVAPRATMHRLVSVRSARQRPAWMRLDRAIGKTCEVYVLDPDAHDSPAWEM